MTNLVLGALSARCSAGGCTSLRRAAGDVGAPARSPRGGAVAAAGAGRDRSLAVGTAIAEDFALREAPLAVARGIEHTRDRSAPMVAQTLGRSSPDGRLRGPVAPAGGRRTETDGERLPLPPAIPVESTSVGWSARSARIEPTSERSGRQVLAPETWGDVLSLRDEDLARFRFPGRALGARRSIDFAVGHHHHVMLSRPPPALVRAALPRAHRRIRAGDARARRGGPPRRPRRHRRRLRGAEALPRGPLVMARPGATRL